MRERWIAKQKKKLGADARALMLKDRKKSLLDLKKAMESQAESPLIGVQDYSFVERMRLEAALMGNAAQPCSDKMCVRFDGRPLDADETFGTIKETDMSYRLLFTWWGGSRTNRYHFHEKPYMLFCDMLKPHGVMLLRDYTEFQLIMFGASPDTENAAVLRWLSDNTFIGETMFEMARQNEGLPVKFSVDWRKYLTHLQAVRRKKTPESMLKLRTPSRELEDAAKRKVIEDTIVRELDRNQAFLARHDEISSDPKSKLRWVRKPMSNKDYVKYRAYDKRNTFLLMDEEGNKKSAMYRTHAKKRKIKEGMQFELALRALESEGKGR